MFILASNSPRRKELLASCGQQFIVKPSDAEEVKTGKSVKQIVKGIAKLKAEAVFSKDGLAVLAADTVVVYKGRIIGKPKDEEDAVKILKTLSGKTHYVITAVCLITDNKTVQFTVKSKVTFNLLTEDFILDYVKTKKPLDKAGAYGIQDGNIVKKYKGSYTNIVGLPMEKTEKVLKEAGLWQE